MAKKKTNRFRGRTSRSMERSTTDYGYLNLPENVNVFKAEGGTEVIFDILPYIVTDENHIDHKKYEEDAVVGELWWKRPLKIHRDVGPDNISAVCPTTFGNKCPICEHGSQRRKEGAEWEDDLEFIFPKNRTLFYVVPVDVSECEMDYKEGEAHVFDMSDHNFLKILDEDVKRDIDFEGFPDHEDGLSLKVYFRAKKLGKNKYAEASKIDFQDREDQYDDAFVDELPSLDSMLKVFSYKELKAMWFGMEDLDDEDTDTQELVEEETPTRRRKTTATRTSRRSEPKPESEPEPDGITADELAELPRRALNKLARANDIKPTDYSVDEVEALREEVATVLEIKLPEAEPEPEPTQPQSNPASRRTKKEKCPHGLRFGIDTDSDDACDTCKLWDDCSEEKEKK